MDSNSDEGTSAGNTTFINECGLCGTELEKKIFYDGLGGNNSDCLCGKCVQKVVEVNDEAVRRVEIVKGNNGKVTSEVIRRLKEMQEFKNFSMTRIKDFKTVENVKTQIWGLQRDFKDCISVIMSKQNEKVKLCEELNGKQNLLYELINKVAELENGITLPVKQPSTEEFLMDENQELLEKIRDIEIDSFLHKKELHDALQIVKSQTLKEKSISSQKPYSDIQNLSSLIEISSSLQEEILQTRRKIEALSELHSFH